ncbi:hypothetical protein VTK26DRAFT_6872 [Humicola hyalothermophila]
MATRRPDYDPPKDDPWGAVDMINQSPPVDCTKPYDTSTLAGKTILITGGASGFGAAFARHWAKHGSHIIIGDVNDRAGEQLVAELRSSSPSSASSSQDHPPQQHFHYQHCDVTSWADQVALFQAAASSSPTGGIDAVVAGAGIVERGDPFSGNVFDYPANLDAANPAPPPLNVLAVNLTGVMYTTHLALFWLGRNNNNNSSSSASENPRSGNRNRDKHLLLVASVAGLIPLPGQTEYTASKHAVMGLFRALRGTASATTTTTAPGVRVNVICPYFVDTPLLPRSALALLAGAAKAELRDVVDAATRLMADESVRGRALVVGPRGVRMEEEGGQGEGKEGRAVWEVYGHDYERVEVFMWRYLKLLNVMREIRGWIGLIRDLWVLYVLGGSGR